MYWAGVVSPKPCVINFQSNFRSIWPARLPLRRHTCRFSLGKGDDGRPDNGAMGERGVKERSLGDNGERKGEAAQMEVCAMEMVTKMKLRMRG